MATMTLTIDDAHVPRVLTAFGSLHNYVDGNGDPRDATAEEVRTHLIAYLKERVLRYERSQIAAVTLDVT